MKNILITGGAGFIGSHLIDALLVDESINVTCIDNFDEYYNPQIKKTNIKGFVNHTRFRLIEADINDIESIRKKLDYSYTSLVHLAAKAGVRSSILFPQQCYTANIQGTQNMLEIAKELKIKQFIFGSSSSVYGLNSRTPWNESDRDFNPISPYAASKVSGEMLGQVYAYLYGIQLIILRFFTVYGPRQRPDLAIHKFTDLIYKGKPIPMYGDGSTKRDYTFVGDIVQGILAAIDYKETMFEIVNLGNNQVISLSELIDTLASITGKNISLNRLPAQAGDVPQTYADITKAKDLFGYSPAESISSGLAKFIDWYKQQHNIMDQG
jgi:UDP-glucuronate 4-epimerase